MGRSKKYKYKKTATTEQVASFIECIGELEWTDFLEVTPGQFLPHPDAYPKIERLKAELEVKVLDIEAEEEALRIKQEQAQDKLATMWIPVGLSTGNTDSITSND